ncbi:hypothetical protein HpHA181_00880 [Helicobacter pylori]
MTSDNDQTLDLQIEFIANENQKVIESQIIPTAEQAQAFSKLKFIFKKGEEEIYNDYLNIARIPNFPPIPNSQAITGNLTISDLIYHGSFYPLKALPS